MESFQAFNITEELAYHPNFSGVSLFPLLLLSLSTQKHSPKTKREFQMEYDYIIVGAGAAGSVVASRLSEIPCVNVLLIEAGKPPPVLTELPSISSTFLNSDLDWKFKTTPQRHTAAGLTDRRIPWPSGKTLGGSTTINGMLVVRGNRKSYNKWAASGATGWSYKEVLPYFQRLEDFVDPVYLYNGFHGVGGPVTISTTDHFSITRKAIIEAVLDEGFNFIDVNGPTQTGFIDSHLNMRRGQRCGTAKAYLVPSENRTNLDILVNAMARKVLIENKRAIGVEFDFQGSTHQVKARKEVILSAGTTNSAQLLMLSGIGPMSELMKLKIPLEADLPVGRNLQNHVMTSLMYEISENIASHDEEVHAEENIKEYINQRSGPLTVAEGLQVVAFLSTTEDGEQNDMPDYELYIYDLLESICSTRAVKPEIYDKVFKPLLNKTTLTCTTQILFPESIGQVYLQSKDPYDPPAIDPNYFANFRDIEKAVHGMKMCQRIMRNPAMVKIDAKPIDTLIPGCEKYADDDDLYFRCIIRTLPTSANHMVGTVKMGDPKDQTTVVDPQLRVKGIKNLRVVDASVMPSNPGGNINIPTIMIGEKASDMIKETIHCNSQDELRHKSPGTEYENYQP